MYFILTHYKLALLGISALLAVCGLLMLGSGRSKLGLGYLIREYWEMRREWNLGLLVLAVLLLNCFFIPAEARLHASAGIAMNYNLASQGLNPNGTRFNQTDILNDEILEQAIERGALEDVTVRDLKRTIQVRPVVQGSSSSYFISTQFSVRYNADEETMHQDGEKLLNLVTQTYREWFVKEYSSNTSALKMDFSKLENQDYLDSCSFLTCAANSVGEYMSNMSSGEPAFRSGVNGETFQSVSSQAYEVANTLVETLKAYVLEEGISRDAAQYISRLNVANVFLNFDAQKAAASNENTLEAISMYENDMARIVLVPTYDTNNQFYMSQTRIGVDDFAANADHYADEKVSIYGDIADNTHIIEQFSVGVQGDGPDAKADALIDRIEQELVRIAGQAEELVKEYNARQANNYMTITISSVERQAKSLAVNIAVLTLLFDIGLRLCWFALHEGRRRRWPA